MLFKTRGLNSITGGKCVRVEEGLGWKATKTPVLQTQPRLPFCPSHREGVCVPPRASEWASECSDQETWCQRLGHRGLHLDYWTPHSGRPKVAGPHGGAELTEPVASTFRPPLCHARPTWARETSPSVSWETPVRAPWITGVTQLSSHPASTPDSQHCETTFQQQEARTGIKLGGDITGWECGVKNPGGGVLPKAQTEGHLQVS